jgi:hypothetical protein
MEKCFGFDFTTPANQGWTGTTSRSSGTFRNGTHSMLIGGTDAVSPAFTNTAGLYAGAAVRWTSVAAKRILAFFDSSTAQITVTVESDGALKVRRGATAGTVLASSSAGVFTANTWNHLQLYVLHHGSSGAVELKLNGTTVASASGVNTLSTGNAYSNKIAFTGPDGFSTCFVDDFWYSDVAFQGDCKVETTYPTANGTTNNYNVSGAASNYLAVDDPTDYDSDTTYTFGSNVADKDLYGMGNLVTTAGTVKMVNVNAVMRKDDAGTREAAILIKQATESTRATNSLTTSYVIYSEAFTVDPTDSVAWTIATVNSLEVGTKIIT